MVTKVRVPIILKNKCNFRLPTNHSGHGQGRISSPCGVRAGGNPREPQVHSLGPGLCESQEGIRPSTDRCWWTDSAGSSLPGLDLRRSRTRKPKLEEWEMEVWDFIDVDSVGLTNRALQTLFKSASQWRRNLREVKAKLAVGVQRGGYIAAPAGKGKDAAPRRVENE